MESHIQQLLKVRLRWMERDDLPLVFELERSATDRPGSPQDFLAVLARKNGFGIVVEHDGHLVGFLVYEVLPEEILLHHIAVAPAFRRRGAASQMIARVCCQLNAAQRRPIRTDVRESNLAAQLFFQSLGFRANMILKTHFRDTGEDAYRMQYQHKRLRGTRTGRPPVLKRN